MWVPKMYGGLKLDAVSAFRVVEEVARIDSSAAWNLQISLAGSSIHCWFQNDTPREIFESAPDTIIAAAFSPPGQLSLARGGYRLNGHRRFGSGCQYCSWYIGPALVAIESVAKAVDLVHAAVGATAIREEYRFQRHFRDVHTMTQLRLKEPAGAGSAVR